MIQQHRAPRWTCAAFALALAACATPYFEVDDAVELEDGRTRFAAFAERDRGPFYGGVEGVDVRFLVDGAEVATVRSDGGGVATILTRIPRGKQRFEATASYGGGSFRRSGKILQWRDDEVVVVCDIDSTISDTALEALFFDETDEKSRPIADSAEVLSTIAQRFGILYFTARPKFTLDKTQRWLHVHGYPEAPVMTSLEVRDLIAEGHYKRRELGKLRRVFPNLLIGIGNSHADSTGYGANGMLSLIVNRTGDTLYSRHEIEFESWRQIGTFFEVNGRLLRDPERLRDAARGEETLMVPTLRYSGAGEEE